MPVSYVFADVPPPSTKAIPARQKLSEFIVGPPDILTSVYDVGIPGEDLVLHSGAVYKPDACPKGAPPSGLFVLWLKPGFYSVRATLAWKVDPTIAPEEAKAAASAPSGNVPYLVQAVLTSAIGKKPIHNECTEPYSWLDVEMAITGSLATVNAMYLGFVTQDVEMIIEVPSVMPDGTKVEAGHELFGSFRVQGGALFPAPIKAPVPSLYSLTVSTLAIPAVFGNPSVASAGLKTTMVKQLGAGGGAGDPATAAYLKAAGLASVGTSRGAVSLASMDDGWSSWRAQRPMRIYRRMHSAMADSGIVTTTSAAYVAPVVIFSVFIAVMFVCVVMLLAGAAGTAPK